MVYNVVENIVCGVQYFIPHVGQHWSIVHDSIADDMDEPTNKLIGRHNYCTQVNVGYQDPTFTYKCFVYVSLHIGFGEFIFSRKSNF